MDSQSFDYYHIYSIPIYQQSLFKVVLPRNKYLLKNQLHYAYYAKECQEVLPEAYICEKEELQELQDHSPCEVQLLASETTPTCEQTKVTISQPIINQLDQTNQWILVFPNKEAIKLKCFKQEETRKLLGTFLLKIPAGCQVSTNSRLIINEQKLIKTNNQPMLFPDISNAPKLTATLNLSVHLHQIKLDDLHQLRNEIIQNQPQLAFSTISTSPSIWTIIMYLLAAALCTFFTYKKVLPKLTNRRKKYVPEEKDVPIQLPLS